MYRHKQLMVKIWLKIINLLTYLNKNNLIINPVNQRPMLTKNKITSR